MVDYAALQVANWFLAKNNAERQLDDYVEPLSQMKLHKLLYYAQGIYLAYTKGNKLFNEDILAWKHGPVVRTVYDKYRGKYDIVDEITDEQLKDYLDISGDKLSQSILEVVYTTYGNMSAWDLRNQTHQERPWLEVYNVEETTDVIPVELIKEFFEEEILVG